MAACRNLAAVFMDCVHAVDIVALVTTGFGANSNQGQIVTSIGYYLGLLVTNLNDSLINLPRPY